MSLPLQTGWQKKGGCPEAFGGYAGVEFPSAIGPYYGMWLWMDAANHYTAGYAGLPVLEAYEYAPQPPALRAAYCYSREVADFYAAFAVRDNATGRLDLPYSCVNENCLGPWGHATPKNSTRLSLRPQNPPLLPLVLFLGLGWVKYWEWSPPQWGHPLNGQVWTLAEGRRLLPAVPDFWGFSVAFFFLLSLLVCLLVSSSTMATLMWACGAMGPSTF